MVIPVVMALQCIYIYFYKKKCIYIGATRMLSSQGTAHEKVYGPSNPELLYDQRIIHSKIMIHDEN